MKSHFRRKPDVIKFNNSLINFAALCPVQTNEFVINNESRQIFELYNPKNKYQLTMGCNLFFKYSEVFKNNANKILLLSNFTSLIGGYGFVSDAIRNEYIKEIEAEDPLEINSTRNMIRAAFIEDLKCNVNLVFVNNSINPIDFCFDTIKSYSENKIEGIQLSSDGIINASSITVTIFINKKYLADIIRSKSVDNLTEIRKYLFGSLFRDSCRIENTQRFMCMLNLYSEIDLTFLNTASSYLHLNEYKDERFEEISKMFVELHSDKFEELNNDSEFKTLLNIFSNIKGSLNPLNIINLIEPNNESIVKLLKIVFTDLRDDLITEKFISSETLKETDEDPKVDKIKKMILSSRILPILQFYEYYFQNANMYNTYKKIDKALEDFTHDASMDLSINFNGIKETHYVNDEYYDEIRSIFKNPLKSTSATKIGFENIFKNYKKYIATKDE